MIKKILVGICYGICVVLLMRGGTVKPLLLSQGLGAGVAALSIYKGFKEKPVIWFAVGFVLGCIAAFFLNIK